MPLVVSDTSPIRALSHLQRLDLLSRLFDVILIPPAVSRAIAAMAAPPDGSRCG
jgi:predicted nucleic acid-binding protein